MEVKHRLVTGIQTKRASAILSSMQTTEIAVVMMMAKVSAVERCYRAFHDDRIARRWPAIATVEWISTDWNVVDEGRKAH